MTKHIQIGYYFKDNEVDGMIVSTPIKGKYFIEYESSKRPYVAKDNLTLKEIEDQFGITPKDLIVGDISLMEDTSFAFNKLDKNWVDQHCKFVEEFEDYKDLIEFLKARGYELQEEVIKGVN